MIRLSDDESLSLAVESAERYADGLTTADELRAACEAADAALWAFSGVISQQLTLAAVVMTTKEDAARECTRTCRRALWVS